MKATLDEMENARGDRETFSRTDIAFHLAIAKGSKNSLYATILAGLERRCIDYANINRGSEDWYSGVIDRHRAILSAIVDGDPEAASDAMHRHLVLSRRHYVDKQDGA